MTSTLQDRIQERLTVTGLTNAQLAKACNVKQPTSFNWGSGKTKNIKGAPLLLAAKALGVTPNWLATGALPKYPSEATQSFTAQEETPRYPDYDPWTLEAIGLLNKLHEADRRAAVIFLRTFIQQLGPPGYGQGVPLAEHRKIAS